MKITAENIPMLLNTLTIGNYVVEAECYDDEIDKENPLVVSMIKRSVIMQMTDLTWVTMQRIQKCVLNQDPYLSRQTCFNAFGPINLKSYLESHIGWDIRRINDLRFSWDNTSEIPKMLNPFSIDGFDVDDDDDDMEDDDE